MTMECWILYDRADLEHNRFFAERLRGNGERLGMRTRVVTTDSMDGVPDIVVSRARDWRISERLESLEKIWDEYQVYNNDEIDPTDGEEIQLLDPNLSDR